MERNNPPEKDGVHWITGQEPCEIEGDPCLCMSSPCKRMKEHDRAIEQAAREDEQRKWRDEHTGDLVWMTPEEEEARIRRDEREKVLKKIMDYVRKSKYFGKHFMQIMCESLQNPATPVKEQIVAAEKRGYERALDDLGVLHGEDARKFNEYLENPSPLTPEAAEVMRKARELAARK